MSDHAIVLAAEIDNEIDNLDRTIAEITEALARLQQTPLDRIVLYAAAAMLETFYSGAEKALSRIARTFTALPQGDSWHRDLLHGAAMPLSPLRPAVLRKETASALERYLSFRHRFRNLYLFDLSAELLQPLLQDASPTWQATRSDLTAFATWLRALSSAS